MISIKKGLDLPINGAPEQKIYDAPNIKKFAITGPDYIGMKPTMLVKPGDKVKAGQAVFECKKIPGVKYTAPVSGEVKAINRGERRVFESLVIQSDGKNDSVKFKAIAKSDEKEIRKNLIESGLWTAFRTRPYSKAPAIDSKANSIFVNAMDTHPLAADPQIIINETDKTKEAFKEGLLILTKLCENKVYICHEKAATLSGPDHDKINFQKFEGIHPAGLSGTHIHFLNPASDKKVHWTIGYQDVIAIGILALTGELSTTRVIAFSGPQVKTPRLLRTKLGACLNELSENQILGGDTRLMSGSVFAGRAVSKRFCFLSRFANQVTALKEGREREFLGWHAPGFDKFSIKNLFMSKFFPSKKFNFTTTTHGSPRSMVPIGMYEKVMPLDILPTQLLRALCSHDTDSAQKLGALELDEEDLALCTFVDPGKVDYGPLLRSNLETIEKEG